DEHDLRLVDAGGGLLEPGEGGDDDQIARGDEMRGGTVHADDAAVGLALDRVRLEAIAVRHVPDRDGLVREEVGRVHEAAVDRYLALVVDVGLGHRDTVDLGPYHLSHHRSVPPGTSSRLSISR